MSIRAALYDELEPRARPTGLSRANKFIAVVIILAAFLAILETEETIRQAYAATFFSLQMGFGIFFVIEYLLRVWIAADNPHYAGYRFPRLRWMVSPSSIIDLIAVLPVFLTFASTSLYWLRFARIVRILRIVRIGRVSHAFDNIAVAVHARRFELMITAIIALFLMLVSATLLYFAEAETQPEAFGSIPRALWWSIVTLTTIGYGDVYPVTVFGKFCAALIAISGIGVIAMPTGILAAAFSDAMQKNDEDQDAV